MEPFYGSYMIDTSGIDCGKVIYVRCDGVHEYKTVCELFDECNFTRPAINWCWMIPGINPNQPGIPNPHPGRILGINGTNTCVEWLNPANLFECTDELVGASSNDPTPGYLEDKLTSSDGSISINLIAGGTIIDLTVNIPTTYTLPDPSDACDNCSFLMACGGDYVLKCDKSDLYCIRYMPADTSFPVVANTVKYPLINGFGSRGNSSMVFDGGSPVVNGIKITESGMYWIWMNVGVKIDPSINAIRFMLWSNNTDDSPNKKILLNCKRAVWPTGTPIVDTARGETFRTQTASESSLVWLNQGDVITMCCRYDSDNLPAGAFVVEGEGIIEDVWTPGGVLQTAKKYCGTTWGVAYYPGPRLTTI